MSGKIGTVSIGLAPPALKLFRNSEMRMKLPFNPNHLLDIRILYLFLTWRPNELCQKPYKRAM